MVRAAYNRNVRQAARGSTRSRPMPRGDGQLGPVHSTGAEAAIDLNRFFRWRCYLATRVASPAFSCTGLLVHHALDLTVADDGDAAGDYAKRRPRGAGYAQRP